MLIQMLKSKIQKAIVTNTKLYYNGSIGIDEEILKKSNIFAGEKVQVLNYNSGYRLETYVIPEPKNSGNIILYGPAAKKGKKGEEICILSYGFIEKNKAKTNSSKIIYLNEKNEIKKVEKK